MVGGSSRSEATLEARFRKFVATAAAGGGVAGVVGDDEEEAARLGEAEVGDLVEASSPRLEATAFNALLLGGDTSTLGEGTACVASKKLSLESAPNSSMTLKSQTPVSLWAKRILLKQLLQIAVV